MSSGKTSEPSWKANFSRSGALIAKQVTLSRIRETRPPVFIEDRRAAVTPLASKSFIGICRWKPRFGKSSGTGFRGHDQREEVWGIVDVPHKRYPRTNVAPYSIELGVVVRNNRKAFVIAGPRITLRRQRLHLTTRENCPNRWGHFFIGPHPAKTSAQNA